MKYAYIKDNIATEVVQNNPANLFSPAYASQFVEVPDEVQAGWVKDGDTYAPAPPAPVVVVIPQQVTMRQARLALHSAGLLAGVDAAIAAQDEPMRTQAQIDWEYAQTVDRNFGLVPAMAAALGMTEAQTDDLFILAATL